MWDMGRGVDVVFICGGACVGVCAGKFKVGYASGVGGTI